jgi:hypothetical protein
VPSAASTPVGGRSHLAFAATLYISSVCSPRTFVKDSRTNKSKKLAFHSLCPRRVGRGSSDKPLGWSFISINVLLASPDTCCPTEATRVHPHTWTTDPEQQGNRARELRLGSSIIPFGIFIACRTLHCRFSSRLLLSAVLHSPRSGFAEAAPQPSRCRRLEGRTSTSTGIHRHFARGRVNCLYLFAGCLILVDFQPPAPNTYAVRHPPRHLVFPPSAVVPDRLTTSTRAECCLRSRVFDSLTIAKHWILPKSPTPTSTCL